MYKGKLDTLNVERFARVSRVRFNETRSRCSYDCIAGYNIISRIHVLIVLIFPAG